MPRTGADLVSYYCSGLNRADREIQSKMLRLPLAVFLWIVFTTASVGAWGETETRVALVIGNGAYRHAPMLANPVNGANGMAEALRDLGFEVVSVIDADRNAMVKAINQFRKTMRADGVGLFYYAGHGMQVDGRNYLLPVDAQSRDLLRPEISSPCCTSG